MLIKMEWLQFLKLKYPCILLTYHLLDFNNHEKDSPQKKIIFIFILISRIKLENQVKSMD